MRSDRVEGYGRVAILLHWAIVLLFATQIPLGYVMSRAGDNPVLQFQLFQWHKSIGFLTLAVALFRALWSLAHRRAGSVADNGTLERLAARCVHGMLLALTLVIPLTGWAVASASPLRIPSFVFDLFVMPGLPITVSDAAEAFWSWLHRLVAYGSMFLIVAHAAAALLHHYYRKDDTLHRMLPLAKTRK